MAETVTGVVEDPPDTTLTEHREVDVRLTREINVISVVRRDTMRMTVEEAVVVVVDPGKVNYLMSSLNSICSIFTSILL